MEMFKQTGHKIWLEWSKII